MTASFLHVPDLAEQEIPEAGILSRTLYADARIKVVVFGMDADQELSEHTASMPATLHFVKGEAMVTLGDETIAAKPGTWIQMSAGLSHAIAAKTPLVMLLVLTRKGVDPG